MTAEGLEVLIHRDDLAVKNEFKLFEALIRWAKAECNRQGTLKTPNDCLSVLEPLIPRIRFPQIEPGDFTLKVASRDGRLTTEEMVSVLLYYNIPAAQRAQAPPRASIFNAAPRQYWVAANSSMRRVTFQVQRSFEQLINLKKFVQHITMKDLVWEWGLSEFNRLSAAKASQPGPTDFTNFYGQDFALTCALNENSIPALIAKIKEQTQHNVTDVIIMVSTEI